MNKKTIGSWVESANLDDCDFPIENLPFGSFHLLNDAKHKMHIGIAIGSQILPLTQLSEKITIPENLQEAFQAFDEANLNAYMAMPEVVLQNCRKFLIQLLENNSAYQSQLKDCLILQADVQMQIPCRIPDFTDFYSGIHHATNVGKMLRPDEPLAANYQWIPVAYHGRSSSIVPSGKAIVRPVGQTRASGGKPPYFQATRKLDYELELGVFIGKSNSQGHPIAIENAEEHFFGMCILNDWSARDIQAWEAMPLGPFLAKNFATSISPWIVTKHALAPFRAPWNRKEQDPQPLDYLESKANRSSGAIQIELEIYLLTSAMKEQNIAAQKIASSEFSHAAYWTVAQLITHHASNGCNLSSGDLFGTGTLSGELSEQAGSLLELSQGGKLPITLDHGEQRSFLEDGDTVIFKAYCVSKDAVRIGLGECRTEILPTI